MPLIELYNIPELNATYEHVYDFPTHTSWADYFLSNRLFYFELNTRMDAYLTELTVPCLYHQCQAVSYLRISENGLHYYYFVVGVDYCSASASKLKLVLDVWTTYQLVLKFLPSYVERMHVDRWDSTTGHPTPQYEGEPFSTHDYVVARMVHADNSQLGCYIYTSSNPLGRITSRPTTGGSSEPSSPGEGGNYSQGIPSPNGFLFIKSYEGLAQYPHNIGDGVLTIGYGCTDAYDAEHFNQLAALAPVSDEAASEVFAHSLINNYGLPLISQLSADGYQPNQQEFDALLSFVYNAGLGSLIRSEFYPYLLSGDKETACELWLTQNILPGSQFENGLRTRRAKEVDIFKSNQYAFKPILVYQYGQIVGQLDTISSYIPSVIDETTVNPEFVNQLTQDELGNVYQFPVAGRISATFPTYPDGTAHSGIDIAGNDGLKIRSSGTGVVINIGTDTSTGYGNYCVIEMTNGSRHWFGHMKTPPYVEIGQTVNPKTVLGIVGSTGNSTGPHVHWEIRVAPYAYDATCWINPSPSTVVGDIIEGVGD